MLERISFLCSLMCILGFAQDVLWEKQAEVAPQRLSSQNHMVFPLWGETPDASTRYLRCFDTSTPAPEALPIRRFFRAWIWGTLVARSIGAQPLVT